MAIPAGPPYKPPHATASWICDLVIPNARQSATPSRMPGPNPRLTRAGQRGAIVNALHPEVHRCARSSVPTVIDLSQLKVGDKVVIRATEALAIKVEKP